MIIHYLKQDPGFFQKDPLEKLDKRTGWTGGQGIVHFSLEIC